MADVIPPRRNEILTGGTGVGTTRFMEYLERVSTQGNETAASVDAQIVQLLSAQVAALQAQLGSGDALTSDCDSLTVDSTVLYVDQTEA